MKQHAARRGIKVIGMDTDAAEHQPYIYWHECHRAIALYLAYLTEAWNIVPMGGILGLDMQQTVAVVQMAEPQRGVQLRLLAEIKAFADGARLYYDKHKPKTTKQK